MPINNLDSDSLDEFWNEKTNIIRAFIENRPGFENLCEEVSYVLKTRLNQRAIENAYVTSRTKTLNSFIKKVSRKKYQNPLEEITDIAGVRVIFLYQTDRHQIEEIIESEFNVVEKIDKVTDTDPDRFGYGALHYLVSLWKKSSGARYDSIKDLVCEIQVRTVLQDSWALFAHHLSYKQESEVPKKFRRRINSLSAIFEDADDKFDNLRKEIDEYKTDLKAKELKEDELLNQEINYDTLHEYLLKKYPSRDPGPPEHLSVLITELLRTGYTNLESLDFQLNRTTAALEAIEKELSKGRPVILHGVGKVRNSLSIIDDKYDENRVTPLARENDVKRKNYRYLVKD